MEARTNSARFFRGWSKEGAGNREMESDVVSALISKSYSATEELTFSKRNHSKQNSTDKGTRSHSVAKLTRFCIPIEENRSHRHHRPKPLSFNATLEAMRHHHSTVTLLTFRSPPPTTVRRRHRPVRFRRRPIDASVTVFIERKRTGRSPHAEKFMGANFTAHHDPWRRRFSAPQVALTRPRLSRFALHYGRPSILEKNPTAAWTQDETRSGRTG